MAESASFKEKFDNQLTCGVCLDQYTTPKTLPCLHSFCLECIRRLPLDRKGDRYCLNCPTCRVEHPLPEGGAEKFPNAFQINSFLELKKDLVNKETHSTSTSSKERANGEHLHERGPPWQNAASKDDNNDRDRKNDANNTESIDPPQQNAANEDNNNDQDNDANNNKSIGPPRGQNAASENDNNDQNILRNDANNNEGVALLAAVGAGNQQPPDNDILVLAGLPLSRIKPLNSLANAAREFYHRHTRACLVVLQLFFVTIAIVGQVGENVALPLWDGAASSNCSIHKSVDVTQEMDPFFILSFASLSFFIIFGFLSLINFLIYPKAFTKEDLSFPQWQFILIGVCDAFNGIFVVFASPPTRTAPFLQAILGNITIPLTIVLRVVMLRKKPTIIKTIAAIAIVLGLVMSLIPIIAGLDEDSKEGKQEYLSQSTASRILWPLCFMFGFVPAVLMNIFEEMSLKDSRKVNLFYLLFWTSLYQLITVWIFFWVDFIPDFGFAPDLKTFGENYLFSLKCFFGYATCDYVPGLRGFVFILMYVMAYIGGGLLLRYAEGATYLAILQALVTPLGALFWSIFALDSCGNIFFEPHADHLTYFSIGGIIIIVPTISLYNIGTYDNLKKILFWSCRSESEILRVSGRNSPDIQYHGNERQPLLAN